MKSAEARHLSRVAALGCALCRRIGLGETPAQVHHVREGHGAGRRTNGHFLVIPLCPDHHTGPKGIHGDRTALKNAGVDELDLLSDVIEQLER